MADQAALFRKLVSGLQIRRPAGEDYAPLLRNDFLFVGIGWANPANDLRGTMANDFIFGITQRAYGRQRQLVRGNLLCFDRREQRHHPGLARDEDSCRGRLRFGTKIFPVREEGIGYAVAPDVA